MYSPFFTWGYSSQLLVSLPAGNMFFLGGGGGATKTFGIFGDGLGIIW